MAKVEIHTNETPEQLLRRFRKKVMRSQKMSEVRRRRWFISKSEQRRIDKKKAIRRLKSRQRKKIG